jgi:uncharacterized protein (DUF849 family)
VPVRPEDLGRAARAAAGAGAFAVHVHPRDRGGGESLAADDVAAAVAEIRDACPASPVGVTTGAWIVPDPAERLATVHRWTVTPDFASVNFHEAGAADLATHLLERGVGVEAGVASPIAAEALLASGLVDRCVRLLLEPMEEALDDALTNLAAIESALAGSRVTIPRLLHGSGAPVWSLIRLAAERGYDTRVGLEDTLTLPDGSAARDNGALVAGAVRIVAFASRGA